MSKSGPELVFPPLPGRIRFAMDDPVVPLSTTL